MDLQHLMSLARKAIDDYKMIEEGDRIAVGISGGKDSLALLYALAGLRRFYPKRFELEAVTVNVGFENMDFTPVKKLCEELEVNYTVIDTDIKKIVFDLRKESNPCSLCSKMRKGAFNDKIRELGCNKLAYAHHKDDVIDTSLLSLIFSGKYETFAPVTYLDRTDLTLIRPLIYVEECNITGFANKYSLHVVKSTCPEDKQTKREYIKQLIKKLEADAPGTRLRLFSAINTGIFETWKKPE
jgi:tRNA(Ile)-lysidine synthase TilS/MesJ